MNSQLETSVGSLDFDANGAASTSTGHRKGLSSFKLPTLNRLDSCIKERQARFHENLKPIVGTYFEQGDSSDAVTRNIQDQVARVMKRCDQLTKPSVMKRVIGRIPLPLFLPIMKERVLATRRLHQVEKNVIVSTRTRTNFVDVCTYAFQPEDCLGSLCEDKRTSESKWQPEFQLFETASSEHTWSLLGYTEDGFNTWWRGRRAVTKVADSWADLKALCKSVVFVCDDIWTECMERFPHINRIRTLASQCREMAVQLVRLFSLYTEFAKQISIIFGFTVPLIFALSIIACKAKELLDKADAILSIRAEHLVQRISELEPLIGTAAQLLKDSGAHMRCRPYVVAAMEDDHRLSYTPKPSLAQLFNLRSDELAGQAQGVILETGLVENEENLKAKIDQIQHEEIKIAGQQIIEKSVDEEGPGYDLTVLKDLGLEEITVAEQPLDLLGTGASSVVSLFASRDDASKMYAIKHNKLFGKNITWNKVKREASIWVDLRHDNVLPLLGWCMHPTQQYPALVTPVCSEGDLNFYLRRRCVSDRKRMEFLYDIVSGLEYLHSQKVCHGDLRAANILVDSASPENTRAVICDFGLSDFFEEVTERLYRPTEDQETNDKWLAPELLFPNTGTIARVSREADVYAFGCVILEVAFNTEPYPGHVEGALDQKRKGKLPASKSKMNEVYWPIAEVCWEYLPKKRPSASWIASFLANLLNRN